tara:strand:- start:1 stop:309 length:309 start_codon:yes stop_codon:yes gene_type:complete
MQDLIFYFYQDGGHAWLKVSKDTFKRTNKHMYKITTFSYHDNKNYYFEEDIDATFYLKNLKAQNIKYSFIYVDDGDYSPIRNLPRIESGLLKEPKQLVLRGF